MERVHRRQITLLVASFVALLASSVGVAQTQAIPRSPQVSLTGTVEAVSGRVMSVRTPTQVVPVAITDKTEVWKGKVYHDASPVAVGDSVAVGGRIDAASGRLIAENVWLDIVNFDAVITGTRSVDFEVLTHPGDTDPQSSYKHEKKIVELNADTVFETSAREDLVAGRIVQIVGLDLNDGIVLATKVVVYDSNQPVRMGNKPVILPDGQILR